MRSASAQVGVEHVTAQCDCVVGQVTVPWPGGGHLAAAVDEANACQPMPTERDRVDVEQRQFTQGPRCEGVAARFVPRDGTLLDDGDVVTRPREPGGDRRARRTAADDEDVGVQGACRQPADAGEPAMASGPIGMISASPIAGASGEVKS
jgi:hypothetical protein